MSCLHTISFLSFFFTAPATTEIYTLSLHDALPISTVRFAALRVVVVADRLLLAVANRLEPLGRDLALLDEVVDHRLRAVRSEEHTSELQSHVNLVCRLLLEKKKKKIRSTHARITNT